MISIKQTKILFIIIIILLLGIGVAVYQVYFQPIEQKTIVQTDLAPHIQVVTQPKCLVELSGAVVRPGIYNVSPNIRVKDLVQLAGGLTADADINRINQVKHLKDGQKIFIPAQHHVNISHKKKQIPIEPAPIFPININTASESDLMAIPDMKRALAKRIMAYRQLKGHIYTIDELRNVKGLTDTRIDELRRYFK